MDTSPGSDTPDSERWSPCEEYGHLYLPDDVQPDLLQCRDCGEIYDAEG